MKKIQLLMLFILSTLTSSVYALEFNTSPLLTSTSEYKFYTANVLFDSNENVSWGPTMGMGLDSDVSLMFVGGRMEYTKLKHFYGAAGYSLGFLHDKEQANIAVFPFMYSTVGLKYQYSNCVFKFGIGMMSSKIFSQLQDKSILSDSSNEKTMVPTAEIKVGYRF